VSLVGGGPKLSNVAVFQNVTANAVMIDTGAGLDGCYIANNSDVGMYLFPSSPSTVDSCTIAGNGSGGIVLESNSSTFTQCGILANEGAGVEITNVSFAAGSAQGPEDSSGERSSSATTTAPTFLDCVIAGNVNTSASGGGIRFDCSNLPTSDFVPYYGNCVITGNASIYDGGGIAVCGVSALADIAPQFENCTISSNSAGGLGGGIYCNVQDESEVYSGIVTMERSIMWGNCAVGGGNQAYTELENIVMFDCSDIDSAGVDGVGNIIYGGEQAWTDPNFCDPATCNPSGTIEGEFTVATNSPVAPENSPCGQLIGAGTPVCAPPTGIGDTPGTPAVTALQPNVPNPFNPVTTIRFDLARPGPVTLVIYDVRGRRVRTLVDAFLPASHHARIWDGTNDRGEQIATGVYFARLQAGSVVETRKMVLVK
jgi:predicted outer membrane repeat protein